MLLKKKTYFRDQAEISLNLYQKQIAMQQTIPFPPVSL